MNDSIDLFRTNINRVKNLDGIYSALESSTTPVLDLSDLLRAELVMTVSVLDHFIHSMIEEGMAEIYQNQRNSTIAYTKFEISLANIPLVLATPQETIWFKEEVKKKISHQSFQRSDKISPILKLISDKNIWSESASILNRPQQDITLQLNLIADRRNQIVHQADIDPTYPNQRWPIDIQSVDESVEFIENLSETIFQIVN